MKKWHDYLRQEIRIYFNPFDDKEEEQQTIDNITSAVRFRGAQLWILIFAIFIASLGLNVNSTAVIIGAMLISPLMGPIIGMGLSIGIGDLQLLKVSAKNFIVATVISIATAAVYFIISPYSEVQSELLARTSPTLYDVLIAFFGGAAGFMAIATRGKGNVIPGVAIATALMPPLCTAGFGLATGKWMYFLGAIYLFYINTVFICLSTFLGTRLLRFRPITHISSSRAKTVQRYILIIVLLTMIPAALLTARLVQQSIYNRNVNNFISQEWNINGTQIIGNETDHMQHALHLIAVGNEIPLDSIELRRKRMDEYHLGDYSLIVIQGSQRDSLVMLSQRIHQVHTSKEKMVQQQQLKIAELEDLIKILHSQIDSLRQTDSIQNEVMKIK